MSDPTTTSFKPLSLQAKAWAGYLAKEVKTQTATNHDQIFLVGRSLFDKDEFNRANDQEHAVIHGFQVIYGPFSNLQAAHEFIANYSCEFPGENDWKWIHPGQVEIISPYFEPGKAEIVHNASLQFQGQLAVNETQRKIKEIEEIQRRLREREDQAVEKKVTLPQDELETRIHWQQNRVKEVTSQLEQMKKHLEKLEALKATKA